MGMLDADIVFAPDKVLRRRQGSLHGYEIHNGRVARCSEAAWFEVERTLLPQGIVRGPVFGTHWHGLFDNDDFRRCGSPGRRRGGPGRIRRRRRLNVAARRDAQLDLIADLLAAHLDVDAIAELSRHRGRQPGVRRSFLALR